VFLLVLTTHPAAAAAGAELERFLAAYLAADAAHRPELVETFRRAQEGRGGFPIRDADGSVSFVWFGQPGTREVRLLGDFARRDAGAFAWDPEGLSMTRAGDVFHLGLRLEPDARLDYLFMVDGTPRPDPLNPRRNFSVAANAEASVLAMPAHRPHPATEPRSEVPRGRIVEVDADWASPRVRVYLPPGHAPNRSYPVLLTSDGEQWIERIRLPAMLDHLLAEGAIAPLLAAMIDAPPDRESWHLYNPDYLAHLRRVVAHVDMHLGGHPHPRARVHAGTASGARAALYAGLEAPDSVSGLALLSPSLVAPIHHLEPWLSGRRTPDPGLRVWMSAGTYEGYVASDTRTLHAWFERNRIHPVTLWLHQGHGIGAWREAAVAMLQHHFPPTLDLEDLAPRAEVPTAAPVAIPAAAPAGEGPVAPEAPESGTLEGPRDSTGNSGDGGAPAEPSAHREAGAEDEAEDRESEVEHD
jgi:enterochelin esterase family protein